MARKSNKTSHVLNLLAGSDTPPDETTEDPVSSTETVSPNNTAAKPAISVIDTTGSKEDPVADLIKQRLMEDEEEPPSETLADDIVETVNEITVEEETEEMSLPSVPEKEPEPDAPLQVERKEEPVYDYVNVMERIVRDKVIYFVREFKMCDCDRCLTDITALSLSNLPPKYIVAEHAAVSPLLNYYTNKFISRVTVEVTKACMIVKELPHH